MKKNSINSRYIITVKKRDRVLKKLGYFKQKEYGVKEIKEEYNNLFRNNPDYSGDLELEITDTGADYDLSLKTKIKISNNDDLLTLISSDINTNLINEKDENKIFRLQDFENEFANYWHEVDFPNESTEKTEQLTRSELHKDKDSTSILEEMMESYEDNVPETKEVEQTNEAVSSSKQKTTTLKEYMARNKPNKIQDQNYSEVNNETVPSKQDYYSLEYDSDINELIEEIKNKVLAVISKNSEFVLESLEQHPTDNEYITQQKEKFIRNNYSVDEANNVLQEVETNIQNTLNTSRTLLIQAYDTITSTEIDSKITAEIDKETKQIKNQFHTEKDEVVKNHSEQNKQELESLHNKKAQEISDIEARYKKEELRLIELQKNNLKQELQALKAKYNNQKTVVSQQIKDKLLAEDTKKQLQELNISRSDLINQTKQALSKISLDTDKKLDHIKNDWNKKINDNQSEFDLAYEKYQQDLEKKALQEKEAKEQEMAERELALKEKTADNEALKATKSSEEMKQLQNQLASMQQANEKLAEQLAKSQNDVLDMQNSILQKQRDETLEDMRRIRDTGTNKSKNGLFTGIIIGLTCLSLSGFMLMKNNYDTKQYQRDMEIQTLKSEKEKSQSDLENQLSSLQTQLGDLQKQKSDLENKVNSMNNSQDNQNKDDNNEKQENK